MVKNIGSHSQSPDERGGKSFRWIVNIDIVVLEEGFEEMSDESSLFFVSKKFRKNSFTIPIICFDKSCQVFISFLLIKVRIIRYSLLDYTIDGFLKLRVRFKLFSDGVNML